MHEPHEDYLVEEFRHLARKAYGGKPSGPEPGEHFLVNVERLAKLHAIYHNPYHKLVSSGMSTVAKMHLCADQLMESLNFREAAKVLRDIARIEKEQAAVAPEPAAVPDPDPEPVYKLDPEAVPVRPPPLTQHQAYLTSLSDTEIARQLAAARRRESERRRNATVSPAEADERRSPSRPDPTSPTPTSPIPTSTYPA